MVLEAGKAYSETEDRPNAGSLTEAGRSARLAGAASWLAVEKRPGRSTHCAGAARERPGSSQGQGASALENARGSLRAPASSQVPAKPAQSPRAKGGSAPISPSARRERARPAWFEGRRAGSQGHLRVPGSHAEPGYQYEQAGARHPKESIYRQSGRRFPRGSMSGITPELAPRPESHRASAPFYRPGSEPRRAERPDR